MTATAPASEPIINHADALAPDWDAVPFDVACARCGHNLRGLSKPQCPACDLTFDWSEAIPLEKLVCGECGYHLCGLTETRCPECGTQFTWEDALAEYHRRKKLVFEYRWRDQPVRSLLGTWCLAARPKRLWSTLDLHDPPQIRPLLGQVFIGFILFGAVLVPVMGLGEWLRARWYLRLGLGTWGRQTNGNVSDLPGFIWDALSDWQTSSIVETTGLWLLCSFLALLVFQQSNAPMQSANCARGACLGLCPTFDAGAVRRSRFLAGLRP